MGQEGRQKEGKEREKEGDEEKCVIRRGKKRNLVIRTTKS